MALMPALAALVRGIRHAKAFTQEQMSGSVEARHLHNIENARSSITLDKLEAIAQRLEVDPAALVVLASALSNGLSDEEVLERLRLEFKKLDALGSRERLTEHYREGQVVRVKPGRQIDPEKLEAIRQAKAAGETQKSVSLRLGMPKSTVGRLWHALPD
ncbi:MULTISPECIES: helix-turn-helix domain-containing protein [Pseudomonas putida group]|uniref:helix-turn-helix domain-containing protein n=1 Tax=Pseudomonas putida group TaxID=136845 RepID=UPI0018AA336C|nr:helix-turn-helix transcriptional regulator [Pseudomonas fulva]MBF8776282.1 helix-turn-helix transcriptional regulator [Pseudomonas fulva]